MLPCEAWTDTIEEKLRSRRRSWDVDVDLQFGPQMGSTNVLLGGDGTKNGAQVSFGLRSIRKYFGTATARGSDRRFAYPCHFWPSPPSPHAATGSSIQVTTNKDSMMPICAAKSGK